jgi:hypothetical protein
VNKTSPDAESIARLILDDVAGLPVGRCLYLAFDTAARLEKQASVSPDSVLYIVYAGEK